LLGTAIVGIVDFLALLALRALEERSRDQGTAGG
jgi:hypothetical protein